MDSCSGEGEALGLGLRRELSRLGWVRQLAAGLDTNDVADGFDLVGSNATLERGQCAAELVENQAFVRAKVACPRR